MRLNMKLKIIIYYDCPLPTNNTHRVMTFQVIYMKIKLGSTSCIYVVVQCEVCLVFWIMRYNRTGDLKIFSLILDLKQDIFWKFPIFNSKLFHQERLAYKLHDHFQAKNHPFMIRVTVFSDTFNKISAISWRSVLLVEETGKNYRPAASHLTNFIT